VTLCFDRPNVLMDHFPLVLVPVYLVPLWILLHIALLTKLRREAASFSRRPEAAASSV
jgi:hypothetical protein